MRRGDQKSIIILLFTSILLVGVFSFIGIVFINTLDNSRAFSARVDWRNEAIMLANRFISDPDCLGYAKTFVYYSNETGEDLLIDSKVNVPLAIDRNKAIIDGEVNIERLSNCLLLNSSEYKLYFDFLLQEGDREYEASNLGNQFRFNETLVSVKVPVKIIDETGFSNALLTITMSINVEYLQAKLL